MTGEEDGRSATHAARGWILEAGLERLRVGGATSLTARGVAERAGVAVGSLYAHFGGMDALRDAIYAAYRREQYASIVAGCHPDAYRDADGLRTALRRVVRAMTAAALEAHRRDPEGRIDHHELGEPATDEDVRASLYRCVAEMSDRHPRAWRPTHRSGMELIAWGLPTAIRAMAYRDPERLESARFLNMVTTWAESYVIRREAIDSRPRPDWRSPADSRWWRSRPDSERLTAAAVRNAGRASIDLSDSIPRRLIAGARQLLIERPNQIGARDIAAAAGLSTGSIYNYFGSLRELLDRAHHERVREALEEAPSEHHALRELPLRRALSLWLAGRLRNAEKHAKSPRSATDPIPPFALDSPGFRTAAMRFVTWLLRSHGHEVAQRPLDDVAWILTCGLEGLMRPMAINSPRSLLDYDTMADIADWAVLFAVRDDCLG